MDEKQVTQEGNRGGTDHTGITVDRGPRTVDQGPWTLALFLGPAITLYAIFFLYPMAQAFYIALFRWRGVSMHKDFVGVENFRKLLGHDPIFWAALGHNAAFLVASLVIILPLGLFLAVALHNKIRGASTYRAVFLFPNMISVVAVAVLWSFVYHPVFGVLNAVLKTVGLGKMATGWLGDPDTALPAIIATSIWYSLGFYIVLFLAGAQSIPTSFYEAASIDGATAWQSFRCITLPLLWGILELAVVYLIIRSLNVFGLVWVMTEGGPSNHTDTMLTYLYRLAFMDSNFGEATALGVIVFVLIFGISVLSMRLMKRETVEY